MGRKDVRIKMFIAVLFIIVKKKDKQLEWTSKNGQPNSGILYKD